MDEDSNLRIPSTHAPQKEGSFLPRMNDGGILSRLGELPRFYAFTSY
jgi:hypothetical protein